MSTAAIVAATVVSAAATVVSGVQQSKAAKQQAKLYELEAAEKQKIAELSERAFRLESQRLLARQKALWGKAGVVWTEGTPLQVMEETAAEAELQAQIIRRGGEAETSRLYSLAEIAKTEASYYSTGGYFRAGSSLLAGATTWIPTKSSSQTITTFPVP